MSLKLGVNVDHVATLRQARGAGFPDPLVAAQVAANAGADMIVCHLRGDRRHIQEEDVKSLRKGLSVPLHLEMACTSEMEKIALKLKPQSVCVVPEGPRELTTQGGLDLSGRRAYEVEKLLTRLTKAGIGVSLFIDPTADSLRMSHKIGADTVELCTKAYAEAKGEKAQRAELENLEVACILARELKLHIHAGHGMDYSNVCPVAAIEGMECLNIGFSIMARAVFTGLDAAVREMKAQLN